MDSLWFPNETDFPMASPYPPDTHHDALPHDVHDVHDVHDPHDPHDALRRARRASLSPYMRPLSNNRDPSPTVSSSNSSPPPVAGSPPRHRHVKHRLRDIDRKNICLYHSQHPHTRQEDVAAHFQVERSTISKILKQKDKWLRLSPSAESDMQTVRHRPSKFPDVDERMRDHLALWSERGMSITDSLIRSTALQIAQEFGIDTDRFKASSGWVENFKTRNAIKRGEWARAPPRQPQDHQPMVNPYDDQRADRIEHQPVPQQQHWDPEPIPDPPIHQQLPPISTVPESSPDAAAIQHSPDIYTHHVVHYPPRLPPEPSPIIPLGRIEKRVRIPTAKEADEAIDVVIRYIESLAEDFLENDEKDAILKVKYSIFNQVIGIPYDRMNLPPSQKK